MHVFASIEDFLYPKVGSLLMRLPLSYDHNQRNFIAYHSSTIHLGSPSTLATHTIVEMRN
jgi:hypothetical protein